MEFNFATALIFILLGIVFSGGVLILSWLVRPSRPAEFKGIAYECGEQPVGSPWVKFNIRFYVVALIFVIFDVEVVLLYPWATVFKSLGLFAFIEMSIFLSLLFLGLAYVWKRGDLEWVKPEPVISMPGQKPPVSDAGVGEVTGS